MCVRYVAVKLSLVSTPSPPESSASVSESERVISQPPLFVIWYSSPKLRFSSILDCSSGSVAPCARIWARNLTIRLKDASHILHKHRFSAFDRPNISNAVTPTMGLTPMWRRIWAFKLDMPPLKLFPQCRHCRRSFLFSFFRSNRTWIFMCFLKLEMNECSCASGLGPRKITWDCISVWSCHGIRRRWIFSRNEFHALICVDYKSLRIWTVCSKSHICIPHSQRSKVLSRDWQLIPVFRLRTWVVFVLRYKQPFSRHRSLFPRHANQHENYRHIHFLGNGDGLQILCPWPLTIVHFPANCSPSILLAVNPLPPISLGRSTNALGNNRVTWHRSFRISSCSRKRFEVRMHISCIHAVAIHRWIRSAIWMKLKNRQTRLDLMVHFSSMGLPRRWRIPSLLRRWFYALRKSHRQLPHCVVHSMKSSRLIDPNTIDMSAANHTLDFASTFGETLSIRCVFYAIWTIMIGWIRLGTLNRIGSN